MQYEIMAFRVDFGIVWFTRMARLTFPRQTAWAEIIFSHFNTTVLDPVCAQQT